MDTRKNNKFVQQKNEYVYNLYTIDDILFLIVILIAPSHFFLIEYIFC